METLAQWKERMKSEVEKNKMFIKIGDVLFYKHSEAWTVIDLFDGGFEAKSEYETKDFFFSDLQREWTISPKSKSANSLNFNTKYI